MTDYTGLGRDKLIAAWVALYNVVDAVYPHGGKPVDAVASVGAVCDRIAGLHNAEAVVGAEIARCHGLLLDRLGATATEPLDATLTRLLDLLAAEQAHHAEHVAELAAIEGELQRCDDDMRAEPGATVAAVVAQVVAERNAAVARADDREKARAELDALLCKKLADEIAMKRELAQVREQLSLLHDPETVRTLALALQERNDARIIARCLAHAWDHDTRPLEDWLTAARQWDAYGQLIEEKKT